MMLGPMKKKMITTGIVSFLIPTILICAVFFMYVKHTRDQIKELKVEAEVVERYVFSGDQPIDHIIETQDVKVVNVKGESAPVNSFSQDQLSSIVGQRLRTPIRDKTIVTSNLFFPVEDVVEKDVRTKEFNMISLPTDLEVGDFIDIRILFPTGEDFLVVAGAEVKQLGTSVDSNTVFLNLDEEEMVKLSGAIIESYISDSVNVFAVKYVDPIQQLYVEKNVDYVSLYEDAVKRLIEEKTTTETVEVSGDEITNESGDVTYETKTETKTVTVSESDLTDAEIALAAGMTERDVKAVRDALKTSDTLLLNEYRNKLVSTKKTIVENYPVRQEVAELIASNPNILDDIKAKYNVEALISQRDGLIDTSVFEVDEYTGEIKESETALGNVATKLNEEIETKKAERKEYLQTMIRNSMLSSTTTTAQ